MALKPELTAEEFGTLSTETREQYKEVKNTVTENGETKEVISYVPDIEGVENTGNLVTALEERKKEALALKTQLKGLEKTVNELKGQKQRTEQEKALTLQQKMEEEGKYKELVQILRDEIELNKTEFTKTLKTKEEMFNTVVLDKEVKNWAVTHGGIIP